jgi:hypothetical protein
LRGPERIFIAPLIVDRVMVRSADRQTVIVSRLAPESGIDAEPANMVCFSRRTTAFADAPERAEIIEVLPIPD